MQRKPQEVTAAPHHENRQAAAEECPQDIRQADIVAALKTSFEACDAAWASLNDKTALETVPGRGGVQRTKLSVLIGNTTHNTELYGYICPYMRLKGVVPPTSGN